MEESKERKYYSDLQVEGDLYFPSHAPDLTHFLCVTLPEAQMESRPQALGPRRNGAARPEGTQPE